MGRSCSSYLVEHCLPPFPNLFCHHNNRSVYLNHLPQWQKYALLVKDNLFNESRTNEALLPMNHNSHPYDPSSASMSVHPVLSCYILFTRKVSKPAHILSTLSSQNCSAPAFWHYLDVGIASCCSFFSRAVLCRISSDSRLSPLVIWHVLKQLRRTWDSPSRNTVISQMT